MKLIVGLGNPDREYLNTFHNLGFMVVDKFAEKFNVEFAKKKCKAIIAETRINGEKIILAKPQTYMNLSGESVRELVDFYKIPLSDIFVIYDDFDLNKGMLRIREKGSAGTHNGMRNIVKELSSENFARLRIGFKPEGEFIIPLIDYVLSGIRGEDKDVFDKAITLACQAAEQFAKGQTISKIMGEFNKKTN